MGSLSTLAIKQKIGKCSKCQQVKTLYAKGLCKSCYRMIRYRNLNPLNPKTCLCGCNQTFIPNRPDQIYINDRHRARHAVKRYRQRYPSKTKYLGFYFCHKCGLIGSLYARWRIYPTYSRIEMFSMVHSSAIYSPLKHRKNMKKFGYTGKGHHSDYISKYSHICSF